MADEQVDTDAAPVPGEALGQGPRPGAPPGAQRPGTPGPSEDPAGQGPGTGGLPGLQRPGSGGPASGRGSRPEPQDDPVEPVADQSEPEGSLGAQLAEPLPDNPGFPSVPNLEPIDPDDEGVITRAIGPDGSQSFFLDRDGDGVFESSATGIPLEDGTFEIIELAPLDQPFAPGDDGGNFVDGVFEPGEETPTGEVAVDVPELFASPPEFAAGSADQAPPTNLDQPSTGPADDPGAEAPGIPTSTYEPAPDGDDEEPITVSAQDDDKDDPTLLEQVADAVGDLWDDTKDAVT